MKVKFVNDNELKKVEDVESGTLVQFGNRIEIFGYGFDMNSVKFVIE